MHSHKFLLVDMIFMDHELPGSLQGLAHIRKVLTDLLEPVLDIFPVSTLLSHPLLPLFPATFLPPFFQHHLSRIDLSVFLQTKFFSEKHVHNLGESKTKNQVNDKRKCIFLSAPQSEFPPAKQRIVSSAGDALHVSSAGDVFHSTSQFFPRCLSCGVFHAK